MADTIFTEEWCGNNEKRALEYAIDQVEAKGLYVEIGSFEGRSTVHIANYIYPKTLHAVDPWNPVPYSDYEVMAYSTRPIEGHFDHNVAVATEGNVVKHKMKWEDFFIRPHRCAFVYVDGPHGYDDVYRTLEVLVPQVLPGGVLIGDDYDGIEVFPAVNDYFGQEMYHPTSERTWYWKND